jgi:hypothetical protein
MADLIERDPVIKAIAERQDKATTGTEDCALYTAIKIVRDAPAVNRWIPRSERLPGDGEEVLCYSLDWGAIVTYVDRFDLLRVTHWMPLPEPPESEVQK